MLIDRFWLIGGPMAGKEKTLFCADRPLVAAPEIRRRRETQSQSMTTIRNYLQGDYALIRQMELATKKHGRRPKPPLSVYHGFVHQMIPIFFFVLPSEAMGKKPRHLSRQAKWTASETMSDQLINRRGRIRQKYPNEQFNGGIRQVTEPFRAMTEALIQQESDGDLLRLEVGHESHDGSTSVYTAKNNLS